MFDSIVSRLKKSAGGGQPPEAQDTDETDDDAQDEEDIVDATEVIKSLTDEAAALRDGQEKMLKSLAALTERQARDVEFKKSLGEGMIALMQGQEAFVKSPQPRKGVDGFDLAGLAKGGGGGAGISRHRQLTASDLLEAREVLGKALREQRITLPEFSKAEAQINESIRNPAFQIDPKFLSILGEKK
jgi:hypothetical protein